MKAQCWKVAVAMGVLALASGCAQQMPAPEESGAAENVVAPPAIDNAVAVLHPTAGNEVSGTVHFAREGDGVRVSLRIEHLSPGKHGFHVHEYGDCSAADGTSAGGHFNPFDAPHAARDAAERHVGDLGNVTADDSGVAETEFVDTRIALQGVALEKAASILGRAVIVHGGEDDLTSQPSGDAGPRVACGVVGIAAAPAMD